MLLKTLFIVQAISILCAYARPQQGVEIQGQDVAKNHQVDGQVAQSLPTIAPVPTTQVIARVPASAEASAVASAIAGHPVKLVKVIKKVIIPSGAAATAPFPVSTPVQVGAAADDVAAANPAADSSGQPALFANNPATAGDSVASSIAGPDNLALPEANYPAAITNSLANSAVPNANSTSYPDSGPIDATGIVRNTENPIADTNLAAKNANLAIVSTANPSLGPAPIVGIVDGTSAPASPIGSASSTDSVKGIATNNAASTVFYTAAKPILGSPVANLVGQAIDNASSTTNSNYVASPLGNLVFDSTSNVAAKPAAAATTTTAASADATSFPLANSIGDSRGK